MAPKCGDCGDSSSSSSSSSSTDCSSSSSSSTDCSSSSSSSSSSSCDPCIEKRVENVCKFTGEQIYKAKRNAVVGVQSQIFLTTSPGGTLPASLTGTAFATIAGSGWFIKNHLIVVPAHLVLIPPTMLATRNRYPFISDTQPVPTNLIPNVQQRVSRILINVYNVNNGCLGYGYEARLVGVYGVGDIALLTINPCVPFNARKPKIEKCHPYFSLGRVRRTKRDKKAGCDKGFFAKVGQPVYGIGNFTARLPPNGVEYRNLSGAMQLTKGVLSYKKHIDYSGWGQPEFITVDLEAAAPRSGMPIINQFGCVIGMQTMNMNETLPTIALPPGTPVGGTPLNVPSGDGEVSAISEFFMKPILKALKAGVSRCASSKYRRHLVLVTDPLGDYYRYVNGYAGIAWRNLTVEDYTVTVSDAGAVAPILNPAGGFAEVTPCTKLEGVVVTTLAGDADTDYATVPGAAAPSPPFTAASFVNSPFLGLLLPGDIITQANCVGLGDLTKQISPLTLTKCCRSGNRLTLVVRRASDNFATAVKVVANLIDFPALNDYPWYKVNAVPYIAPAVAVVGLPALSLLPLATFRPSF